MTVGAMFAAAVAMAQQDGDDAQATVKQVMVTMTVPASDAIFSAAWEPPKDDEQWVAVRTSAMMLAASGNVLTTGGRAKDNTTWMEMAREMVKQAEATLKAVEARNGDALAQAGDDVYLTCEACHARYMDK
jgi:hypothetical protein